jgi:SAM-dependent methyltransferase
MPADSASGEHERVLRTVNLFYEENPFPGFDLAKYKTRDDLDRQASWWAHKLDAEIPFEADVVDIGCGTGQLVNFLGLKEGRRMMGVDYSQHSLDMASSLRDKFHLSNVRFQRENILELSLPDASFDYVFCNGVLHHTSDPYGGFQHVVRIARPGAFIVIGLYNTYGRLMLHVRRRVVRLRMKWDRGAKDQALKKQLVDLEDDSEKRRTWWADQYEHPHESTHTVDEVIDWFAKNGVSYVTSFPKAELFSGGEVEKVFKPRPAGRFSRSGLAHKLVQMGWIATQNDGGGYFVMVGRKNGPVGKNGQ